MRTIESYSPEILRESVNALTIICSETNFPIQSELISHNEHIYKVVYILTNNSLREIRLENIKWR